MDSIDGGVGSALDGEPRRGGDARRADARGLARGRSDASVGGAV